MHPHEYHQWNTISSLILRLLQLPQSLILDTTDFLFVEDKKRIDI